jgi:hypothetical protein
MAESWRNILERAASNLSIELDRRAMPALPPEPHEWHAARQTPRGSHSSGERYHLLTRELEALCRPERRPQLPQMRAQPAQHPAANRPAPATQIMRQPAPKPREQPQKSGAARELAVLSISVAVVVLAIYGFLFLLK